MSLASVTMLSATDGWAVGGYGTILRWNGSTWVQVSSPTTKSLFSVVMLSATDGWAVGGLFTVGSTILHWNGNAWIEVNSPATNTLWSVSVVSAADAWAVGDGGTILRWNGNVWSQMNSPVPNSLHSVAMVSATNGWIVAPGGTILYWNGSAWSQANKSTSSHLLSVTMTATDGWAVGSWGTILHYTGGCTSAPPVDLKVDTVLPVQVLEGQPLVKDKATAVKAIIRKDGNGTACNVSAQLTYGPSTYTRFFVDEPFNIDAQHALIADNLTYPLNFASSEITKTIYFFGDNLAPVTDPFTATVMVDYIGAIVETNETNNLTSSPVYHVYDTQWYGSFLPGFPDLSINYFPTDWNRSLNIFDSFVQTNDAFLKSVYPVSEQRYDSNKAPFGATTALYRGLDGHMQKWQLNLWLAEVALTKKLVHEGTDRFVAVVPPTWFSDLGISDLANATGYANRNIPEMVIAAAVTLNHPNGLSTVEHEIGHSYELHLDCEEYYFPDADCQTKTREHAPADRPGEYAASGLWVEKRIPIQVPRRQDIFCFMGASGQPEYWIDAADYNGLFASAHPTLATAMPSIAPTTSSALLVAGVIDISDTVTLRSWFRLPEGELSTLRPGAYTFEYRGTSDTVLYQQAFDIAFVTSSDTLTETPFVFTVPFVDGTTKIVLAHNNIPLAQKLVSANAPAVTVTSPNGGERLSGATTIQWSGSDTDGDQLAYVVLISSNQGTSWEPLAGELTMTSYTWDMSSLPPGTQYLIKVVATDGINTGQDTSNATFTILGQVYLPLIRR
jgi:hypothetical protein